MTGNALDIPDGYDHVLGDITRRVRQAQQRAHQAVRSELVALYWSIGQTILKQQQEAGWGAKVVTRLAEDLRTAFPETTGFNRRNLLYMRAFAAAWPEFVPPVVAQISWTHIRVLLDRLDSNDDREWYATGPSDAAQTQQLVKDPFVFDFLGLSNRSTERDLEQALMDRIVDTLRELGSGFAFAGRQMRFDVGGDEYILDLLFFHTIQLRYIVVELKIGSFEPESVGKLGFYIALVDDRLRQASHAPTIGILLCSGKNETVVRYALRGTAQPMAVSTYTYESLPANERNGLPNADELTHALSPVLSAATSDETVTNEPPPR